MPTRAVCENAQQAHLRLDGRQLFVCVEPSDCIKCVTVEGTQNLETHVLMKAWATVDAVISAISVASGPREKGQ